MFLDGSVNKARACVLDTQGAKSPDGRDLTGGTAVACGARGWSLRDLCCLKRGIEEEVPFNETKER